LSGQVYFSSGGSSKKEPEDNIKADFYHY